ncbi:3D domain-containing protein [Alicyclobacillus fodiniaquatilis]|uniref:3D domain-containing protein n=1 Tax=Alicyclobacillus fodiniaquatilis TaxID=1661150 RepID=A0ABW4JP99_9BACL
MRFSYKKTVVSTIVFGATLLSLPTAAFAATTGGSNSTYVVQGNDTFWTISKQLQVPLNQLLAANPSVNPLNLYPGLTIKLPATTSTQNTVMNASSDNQLSYSKEIQCVATAYTSAASENGWGAVDYFGNSLQLGTVAVDPSVIPLGSKLYITGYTYNGLPVGGMIAHATDEGSAIKGKRVDIYIPTSQSAASKFGMQNVKVYILK